LQYRQTSTGTHNKKGASSDNMASELAANQDIKTTQE